MIIIRPARIGLFIYLLLALTAFGCGLYRTQPSPKPERIITPQMIEEYARMYQISDLNTAEFYLSNPDYAREHPYIPTPKDIAFYEKEFQEKVIKERRILEKAARYKPNDLDTNWNLAAVYWDMGNIEKAAAQMKKYANLDPDNAEAHNIIGIDYYVKGSYNNALDEFRQAVKLNPDEKQYSYNEALVLARLDRYEEAEDAFDRAAGLEEAEYVRKIYAEQIKVNRAKKLHNQGCTAMETLNLTRAIELFEAALEIKPDMLESHVNLGFCYGNQGDIHKQIYHLEEAVKLKPDLPNVRHSLGLAYYDARMYHQAIGEFEQANELDPYIIDSHFKLGMALCRIGRYADAIPEFRRCLKVSSDWYEAHANLGTCYLKTGNPDGAVEHFKDAVRLRPDSAEAYYNLGEAYVRVERFDETLALFRKALSINPGYEQARVRMQEIEAYQGK